MTIGLRLRNITSALIFKQVGARHIGLIFSMVALSILIVFLSLLLLGSSRSFLVEARTGGLRLEFSEGGNAWRFSKAVLCLPLEAPMVVPDPDCGQAAKSDGPAVERLLSWSNGTMIDVTGERDGGIRIKAINSNTTDFPANALFKLSREAWELTGALTFRAYATIGQEMTNGAQHILHDGRWEAREAGLVTSILRSVTEIVKAGDLSSGSAVTVQISETPAIAYGHITAGAERFGDTAPLEVTMISQLGDTSLSVRYFGLREPVVIKPDWIDIAISSPLLLAMAALFSVFASFSQILMSAFRRQTDFSNERTSNSLSGKPKTNRNCED